MLKKSFVICIFLLTASCGYESIYSKKNPINYNFSIVKMNFEGDRDINLKIKQKLNNYNLKTKDREFTLNIKSVVEKLTLAKDMSGDPTSFKNTTTTNVEVFIKDNLKNTFTIKKSVKYNNNLNNFELKNFEKNLKSDLAEALTNELIFKLSNIQ
tara:strand:+ start:1089 stop:1553 length:465 start_codon:yes stop_codon:yes gene_type:complete